MPASISSPAAPTSPADPPRSRCPLPQWGAPRLRAGFENHIGAGREDAHGWDHTESARVGSGNRLATAEPANPPPIWRQPIKAAAEPAMVGKPDRAVVVHPGMSIAMPNAPDGDRAHDRKEAGLGKKRQDGQQAGSHEAPAPCPWAPAGWRPSAASAGHRRECRE